MKNKSNLKILIPILYIAVTFIVFIWIMYPVIARPVDLTPTRIPSLSISGLTEANDLFARYNKENVGYPTEPDITRYDYGQIDPF